MAPKTRAYTKEELQSLRRADLQRLCKTYDIKGANAKSDALIDILVQFFNSPAFLSSPKPEGSRIRQAAKAASGRAIHSLPKTSRARPVPPNPVAIRPTTFKRVAKSSHAAPPANIRSGAQPAPHDEVTEPPTNSIPPVRTDGSLTQGLGLVGELPFNTIPEMRYGNANETLAVERAIESLQKAVTALEDKQSDSALEARINALVDRIVERQLAMIKDREAAVSRREQALESAWSRLEEAVNAQVSVSISDRPGSMEQPGGKRKDRESLLADMGHGNAKRVRRGASSSLDDRTTATAILPRTPSPSHQGSTADDDARDAPPLSAKTPEAPLGSQSPTISRPIAKATGPPPLSYGRMGQGGTRPHHDRSRRKVSQAHIDLSTITESRSGSESHPDVPFLGPIVIHKRPVSPPALSPSPSIGGDNFTYTPLLPAPPKSTNRSTETPARPEFSPGREYMNVALNGFWNADASPSAQATPSSRTMLGTERFRDRRFADEVELVPWTTPHADFEIPSPSQ